MESRLLPQQRSSVSSDPQAWLPAASVIRSTYVFIFGACTLLLGVGLMFPIYTGIQSAGALCMLGVCLTSVWQRSQRQTLHAIRVLVYGTWLTATGLTLPTGGIGSVVLVIYPPLIYLTGWFFGRRAAIILSIVTTLWTLFLALAPNLGLLPPQTATPDLLRWLFSSLVLLFSLFVIIYVVGFHEKRLRKVKELDGALKESESMFRSITEMVPVGIFRADKEGNCLFVNPRYCEISGQSVSESLGRGWWGAVLPEDLPQVETGWRLLLAHGTAFSVEFRLARSDTGVAWVYAQAQQQIDASGECTGHVCSMTDITANKAAELEIQHLAFYDSLTGLPNRRLLMDRLTQAVAACSRSGARGALFFIDLDNFKTLNDTLGHDIGDLLLQQVALRLKGNVREGDTVARLGGDEFLVILENLSPDPQAAACQAELVGEKILASLNQPYTLAGHQSINTPSIGIALFHNGRLSLEELMKRADLAMYQAKSAGRNTLCFFDPEMQAVVVARAAMEKDLRTGLQEQQFLLHYQPQVDALGEITGAEAFVRWQHPILGKVSPASFIPLAEETGLMLPLSAWVLETACQQLARWNANPPTAHLTLSVKVSSQQFRQFNFVDQVLATLARTQARAESLKLELNESLLMVDVEDIIDKTVALKSQGVGFSLADLGTGYSSLSHLKRLSLDQLRVDQSFVRGLLTNPNDASVTRSIFALAESLNLKVSAEGVETQAQRDALAANGCHSYQGYFFSQPLPADEFELLIKAA
jgi:diguanylate cyclase (GGDEF)-like protein/PAS domain S-box-containing protein